MKKTAGLRISVFAAFLMLLSASCGTRDSYVSITGYAQGGTYLVKINVGGENGRVRKPVESIKAGIDSVLLRIDNSVSGYNKGSLLSHFNRGERIVPDDIFIDIYNKSYTYYMDTDGAVDVASGPLFDIWGFGFTSDSLPSAEKVRRTLENSGLDRLLPEMKPDQEGMICGKDMLKDGIGGSLDGDNDCNALPLLNYNAVAQGYSCDLVADYLRSVGVEDMLVDVGGEIFCQGLNPAGQAWSVGVDRPEDGNDTPGADLQGILHAGPAPCGVVTSGNYRKFYVKDGKKYAHTIDPRTGYPVSHSLLSATVIAPDATRADALATYCMVIGFEQARRFIETAQDIEGYLVYDLDGVMQTWASSGFPLSE